MSEEAEPANADSIDAPRFGPWRREARVYLELVAVTGMAVARPTFGTLSNNAVVFATRQTRPAELVALALLLVFGPPLVLWLIEVAVSVAYPGARRAVHILFIAVVAGIFLLAVVKERTDLGPGVLIAVAVAAAAAAGWIYWRFHAVRLFLRYLAFAPIVFAVLFATSTSVRSAVFEPDPGVAHVMVERPHRVVVVMFDEFPEMSLLDGQGAIDAALFPNFAALANESTWYRNTTTVAPYTGAAIPALLTGRYTTGDTDAQVAASAPHSLYTLLGDTYTMNADEEGSRLCPASLCATDDDGMVARLGDLLSVSRTYWWENASPERATPEAFIDDDAERDPTALATGESFVQSLRKSERPRLDVLHLMLPHQGWHYLANGQDYLEYKSAPGLYWDYTWGSEWAGLLAKQRHLLSVAAADRLLGDIVNRLREIGAYDDTLLVVTADHGIAFDHGEPLRGVSRQNFPQILWVPMLMRAPGQTAAGVDDRPAKTIDLLPTIADHLGVKSPWPMDGTTLLGPPASDGPLRILDWPYNVAKPDRDGYVRVPGAQGFVQAMEGRASNATGPTAQRLYQVGPYGALLGRDVEPLTRRRRDRATVTLDDPARFESVRPRAHEAPWTYIAGTIHGDVAADAPLAVTVNGVVAGLSGAYLNPLEPDQRSFWGVLEPGAFRNGSNDIGVAVISGSPEAPVLLPLEMTH